MFPWLLLLTICISAARSAYISVLVPVCDCKAPEFNTCVKNSANLFIPKIKSGLTKVGLPCLNPLKLPRLGFDVDVGVASCSMNLSTSVHKGLGEMAVAKADMNMKKGIWKFGLTIPKYELISTFAGSGRFLLLTFEGKGSVNFTFSGVNVDIMIGVNKRTVKEQECFHIKKVKVKIQFQPGQNIFDFTLDEDTNFGTFIGKFITREVDRILLAVTGRLETGCSSFLKPILRNLVEAEPAATLFINA